MRTPKPLIPRTLSLCRLSCPIIDFTPKFCSRLSACKAPLTMPQFSMQFFFLTRLSHFSSPFVTLSKVSYLAVFFFTRTKYFKIYNASAYLLNLDVARLQKKNAFHRNSFLLVIKASGFSSGVGERFYSTTIFPHSRLSALSGLDVHVLIPKGLVFFFFFCWWRRGCSGRSFILYFVDS